MADKYVDLSCAHIPISMDRYVNPNLGITGLSGAFFG